MLKKMRRRFIAAAMAAIFAVTLVLLLAVNLWYRNISTQRLDETLDAMLVGDFSSVPQVGGSDGGLFDSQSPETKYMTRFFAVSLDESRTHARVYSDYIASVSTDQALEYAEAIADSDSQRGYMGEYRYVARQLSGTEIIVFLNAAKEQQAMRTLLIVSCVTAAVSLAAVFALVAAFSGRAIAPYVKNMELQKQFITDAGHELKTPLTSISTSADVLAMENGENEWVENIQKQCQRLSKLVCDLVTLSRLDESAPAPETAEYSLSDAAWEAAEPFSALAAAQNKQYTKDIEDGLSARGDSAAVQQIISILLDNAFKYSDENGSVRLSVRRHRKGAVIEVFNTCRPGATENMDRFFDRFYRADKARSSEIGGTGIGLSIAKAAVETQGGSISVRSDDGKSIVFSVKI